MAEKKKPRSLTEQDRVRMRALYETGMYPAAELGRLFDVTSRWVRMLIKQEGWAIGATAAIVRKRTAERIEATEEAIEEAVATNVAIIREHQRIGMRGRDLGLKMLAELEDTMENLPKLQELIELATKDDEIPKLRNQMMHRTSTNARAVALRDLASATKTWIDIERTAFNLDGQRDDDPEKWPDERINARIADLLGTARVAEAVGDEEEAG